MILARPMRAACVLIAGLGLGWLCGCAETDPYQRPGLWQPEGVNAGNIATMAQDPRDLIRGHATPGPEWRSGAAAVDRWWNDKAKPLPGPQSGGETASPEMPAAAGPN
jgi:type IV pilus biogenesis protein CpaD/CtpE